MSIDRRLLLGGLAVSALGLAPGVSLATQADRLIVPGKRIGAISRSTKPGDLAKLFGAENVKRAKVSPSAEAEGEGVKVFAGRADEFDVQFTPNGKEIARVIVDKKGSPWRTADGIHVGMAAAAIEKLFGRPFGFAYGMDGGGFILDAPAKYAGRKFGIRLNPTGTFEARRERFKSSDADVRAAKFAVFQLWVNFRD
jgi:hypothetical protein